MIALLAASLIMPGSSPAYFPSDAQLKALAWIESRNNPKSKGKHGEISEYQILPWVWDRFTSVKHNFDPSISKEVALEIFAHNLSQFCNGYPYRHSTSEDYYVMWNWGWPKYHAVKWQFSRVPKSIQKKAKQYAAKVREFEKGGK